MLIHTLLLVLAADPQLAGLPFVPNVHTEGQAVAGGVAIPGVLAGGAGSAAWDTFRFAAGGALPSGYSEACQTPNWVTASETTTAYAKGSTGTAQPTVAADAIAAPFAGTTDSLADVWTFGIFDGGTLASSGIQRSYIVAPDSLGTAPWDNLRGNITASFWYLCDATYGHVSVALSAGLDGGALGLSGSNCSCTGAWALCEYATGPDVSYSQSLELFIGYWGWAYQDAGMTPTSTGQPSVAVWAVRITQGTSAPAYYYGGQNPPIKGTYNGTDVSITTTMGATNYQTCLAGGDTFRLTNIAPGDVRIYPPNQPRIGLSNGKYGLISEYAAAQNRAFTEYFDTDAGWFGYSDGGVGWPTLDAIDKGLGVRGMHTAEQITVPATTAGQISGWQSIGTTACNGTECAHTVHVMGVDGGAGVIDVCFKGNEGHANGCFDCAYVGDSWTRCWAPQPNTFNVTGVGARTFIGNATLLNGGDDRPQQAVYLDAANSTSGSAFVGGMYPRQYIWSVTGTYTTSSPAYVVSANYNNGAAAATMLTSGSMAATVEYFSEASVTPVSTTPVVSFDNGTTGVYRQNSTGGAMRIRDGVNTATAACSTTACYVSMTAARFSAKWLSPTMTVTTPNTSATATFDGSLSAGSPRFYFGPSGGGQSIRFITDVCMSKGVGVCQ